MVQRRFQMRNLLTRNERLDTFLKHVKIRNETLAKKEKSNEANTDLPEDIKTLDNKIEKFTNTFNKLYLQQVGLERCARIYLQSLALFYGTNHHPSKEHLDIPQKRLDAFVRKGKAYTRGRQRYLPSSLGGSGTPNIVATFLASKSFFF